MPRTRAYRRYKRHVKLARRYRLLRDLLNYEPPERWVMHTHIACSCFDTEGAGPERRRHERAWHEAERRAW